MNVARSVCGIAMAGLLVAAAACTGGPAAEPAAAPGEGGTSANSTANANEVPRFEYDPTWPKLPLPNQWTLGEVGGISVDATGHIWIIQRPWTVWGRELAAVSGEADCCRAAPPVIEFDQEGNVVQAWPKLHEFKAPPGFSPGQSHPLVGKDGAMLWEAEPGPYGVWGQREHSVLVDHKNNVWVSNDDAHVLYKFTRDGKHLLTIGEKGVTKGSNDTTHLGRPAGLVIDAEANELFVADGYTNKRVIVFDVDTGAYKRHWGAYGKRPEDVDLGEYDPKAPPAQQFRGPVHGITLSRDGHIYVTDRTGDRVQVFRKNGEYVKEGFVSPATKDTGTAFGVALSQDPQQQWLYVNDGANGKIWILRRETLETVGSFGSQGRGPGQFLSAHSMTVDSQGNIYVGESRGRRVDKFRLVTGAQPRSTN